MWNQTVQRLTDNVITSNLDIELRFEEHHFYWDSSRRQHELSYDVTKEDSVPKFLHEGCSNLMLPFRKLHELGLKSFVVHMNFDAAIDERPVEFELVDIGRKGFEAEMEMIVQGDDWDPDANDLVKNKIMQHAIDAKEAAKEWYLKESELMED